MGDGGQRPPPHPWCRRRLPVRDRRRARVRTPRRAQWQRSGHAIAGVDQRHHRLCGSGVRLQGRWGHRGAVTTRDRTLAWDPGPRSRQQCDDHARRDGWRQARTRCRLEARGLFPPVRPVSRPRSSRQPAQHRLAGHDVRRPRLRRRRPRSSDPWVDDRPRQIRRAEHRRTRSSGARPAPAGLEWLRHRFLAARVVGRRP